MRKYPKRLNGDEYYPTRNPNFVVDEYGKEHYARDKKGNELYPNRDMNIFARDGSGNFYYARDVKGNEYYPIWQNQSLFLIDPVNKNIRLALYKDGTQRYPKDAKGNEYYLLENKEPLLLRKSNGDYYLAQSKNGHELIPWNYFMKYVKAEPCIYSKDAYGNTVYLKESEFSPAFKALIRIICQISVICPKVTGCHSRIY